jgi:hypothetical protein
VRALAREWRGTAHDRHTRQCPSRGRPMAYGRRLVSKVLSSVLLWWGTKNEPDQSEAARGSLQDRAGCALCMWRKKPTVADHARTDVYRTHGNRTAYNNGQHPSQCTGSSRRQHKNTENTHHTQTDCIWGGLEYLLSRQDQIPLILPALIVTHDYKTTFSQVRNCILNRGPSFTHRPWEEEQFM